MRIHCQTPLRLSPDSQPQAPEALSTPQGRGRGSTLEIRKDRLWERLLSLART